MDGAHEDILRTRQWAVGERECAGARVTRRVVTRLLRDEPLDLLGCETVSQLV